MSSTLMLKPIFDSVVAVAVPNIYMRRIGCHYFTNCKHSKHFFFPEKINTISLSLYPVEVMGSQDLWYNIIYYSQLTGTKKTKHP